ncbi:DEAD/DEAH box helicase family protein [Paraburkholderia sediminicola]|uniref:DEAD/DEAH box helicase family protein n=1 Tax=Paraburkholderia sediminicola TaxID=458836 RepID=UPI0038BB3037
MTPSLGDKSSVFLPEQDNWTLDDAASLLDLAGGDPDLQEIGAAQLKTAVALLRILLGHGTAYLADEVGMGKTYVALALVALLRQKKSDLRVLYLTPSRNVREKWARRECTAFNRLLDEQDRTRETAFNPREYDTISQWVGDCAKTGPCDAFLSFSAFSFVLDDAREGWGNALKGLLGDSEWQGVSDKRLVKERVAQKVFDSLANNPYDLLIFDEAHLLRTKDSDRAAFIRHALRGGDWDRPVFRASLLLSATPFDRDLGQLDRQLEVAEPAGAVVRKLIADLQFDRNDGGKLDWNFIQNGLKTFIVRRSHKLICGDQKARSRNQYRVEHRSEASIHLRGAAQGVTPDQRRSQLLQRLYTAVVQKKLVESSETATFPLAMFSSWESYTIRRSTVASAAAKGGKSEQPDTLDVNGDAKRSVAEAGKDTDLLLGLSDSYCKRFHPDRPPHPKLESEAVRLAQDAFGRGDKQLIFVRRVRSINDLKARLDRGYDAWLAAYLNNATNIPVADWLAYRPSGDGELALPEVAEAGKPVGEDDPPLAASFENLFCWFFRGTSDGAAERLAKRAQRPTPQSLRKALTTHTSWLSVIGEMDWRVLLGGSLSDISESDYEKLAAYASEFNRVSKRTYFDTFVCVQMAWLQIYTERLPQDSAHARACVTLLGYLRRPISGDSKHKAQRIDVEAVREALAAPTLHAQLHANGLLHSLWPICDRVLNELQDGTLREETLAEFDLFREVFFALVRLDHPFIDLWLASGEAAEDRVSTAASLVDSFVQALAKQHEQSLTSYRVLRDLALGWKYVLKTNFSDLKSTRQASGQYTHGSHRHKWRSTIARRITPRDPVEWASGMNAKSRPDIAWRFRMPGYPIVLVSTSVFQEGEDLHTYCRHVTHFGISGSPIGIEQKNGRVDRIGSLSQRSLTSARDELDENMDRFGIDIRFPHVAESIEWFQIRDLAFRLNEYQRSLHRVGEVGQTADPTMQQALYSDDEIPPQLRETLLSPFEPTLPEDGDAS